MSKRGRPAANLLCSGSTDTPPAEEQAPEGCADSSTSYEGAKGAQVVEEAEPVAWRFRYYLGDPWLVTTSKSCAKSAESQEHTEIEALYTHPPASDERLRAALTYNEWQLLVTMWPRPKPWEDSKAISVAQRKLAAALTDPQEPDDG